VKPLFRELFEDAIVVEEMDPSLAPADLAALFPEEAAAIVRAVDKRRREYTAARMLARRAMARLGLPAQALVNGEDRAPRWPTGTVGSITHTRGWCAVAMAHASEVRALGLDVEDDTPLERNLWRMILTDEDTARIAELPDAEQGQRAKLVFSIKECAYKAQYLLTQQYLGFSAMSVAVEPAAQRWRARFTCASGEVFSPGDVLEGSFRIRDGFVATALTLR
jgi:4'-phosphopantetheinyl transferase EntD